MTAGRRRGRRWRGESCAAIRALRFSWAARLMPARVPRRRDAALRLVPPLRRRGRSGRRPARPRARGRRTSCAGELDAVCGAGVARGSDARGIPRRRRARPRSRVATPTSCSTAWRWTSAGSATATFEELLLYCYRVAGTVGLMMAHIMGVRDGAALRHATDLGIAMQLTNICRDVAEDAAPRSGLPAGGAPGRSCRRPRNPAARSRAAVAELLRGRTIFYALRRPRPAGAARAACASGRSRRAPHLRRDRAGDRPARLRRSRAAARRLAGPQDCGWCSGRCSARLLRDRGSAALSSGDGRESALRGPRLGLAKVAPRQTPWRAFAIYVGRIREFRRGDWIVYAAWVGLMVGLCARHGGFVWRSAIAPARRSPPRRRLRAARRRHLHAGDRRRHDRAPDDLQRGAARRRGAGPPHHHRARDRPAASCSAPPTRRSCATRFRRWC